MIIDIVMNIGILFIYKYLDFGIGIVNQLFRTNIHTIGIALPIGISFFTFQALSYVIDVYRGNVDVQKNPLFVALYISFFPQLIAGPIVRYSTIADQITNRKCTLEGFSLGGKRFMIGFSKKVLLANNLSVIASEIFSMDVTSANPLLLWIGSICFSLQIYYDFSGYSDMAIGLGKIFGFSFLENFDYPYISKSVTEFWRRWHMSLGQWFRDYVYIPLGGSRTSAIKHIFNMFVVWLLTGIWHGANYTFIIWGLGYFILLVIEKYVVKPEDRPTFFSSFLWRVITLSAVNFGWVIFNSASWKDGIRFCLAMLGRYGNKPVIDGAVLRYCREYGFFIAIGLLFSTPVIKWINSKIITTKFSYVKVIAEPVICGIIFLWAVSYILLGAHNPFIYFNF
jgi:D-alanyl-lipoteichoic acid acyltransferase DltB (MBOAT superfamily)